MKQLSRIFIVTVLALSALVFSVQAQQVQQKPLPVFPEFSALIQTGKNRLEFISGFRDVKSIGVQRSLDSVLNFNTIGYIANPGDIRCAYDDGKPLPGSNYYRMLIIFNNGRYFFTKVVLAVPDSTIDDREKLTAADVKAAIAAAKAAGVATSAAPPPVVTDKGAAPVKEKEAPKEEKIVWHPSNYIYTTADGNVNIKLPEAPNKRYVIKFFEPDGSFLFDIKEVKEPFLILEKAIFLHAGWFNFEIVEDGKVLEKWNVFIPLSYRN
ncbi:hypothetical protein [Chitinophaga sp. LS1]|uniref:hypothetical protein n=1 Tax=Chitinophaga sp. LS1 TaxID=3051176 RepID=UPI002AABF25C|nr:hypothetical protein [Chitinophaga sp. LS1]WPV69841.1 hypothetical protein QQL36_14145 [Chitinophaga sp. LS1]